MHKSWNQLLKALFNLNKSCNVLKTSDFIHVNHSALFKAKDFLVPKHIVIQNMRWLYKMGLRACCCKLQLKKSDSCLKHNPNKGHCILVSFGKRQSKPGPQIEQTPSPTQMLTKPRIYSGDVTLFLTLTLQQLGVDEQFQSQQQPH